MDLDAYWLGRADYEATWQLQERLRQRVLLGGPEVILVCEHPPVLTLGKSASPADLLAEAATLREQGVAVVRTSRGGKITYHGPGQVVLYPILRLHQGIVAHVEALAAAAVAVATQLGIAARYERERVGVFVGPRKLAAIGVHVQRRVTIHGLALNVTSEATAVFRHGWFHPCGELGGQVTCLAEEASFSLPVEAVGNLLATALYAQLGAPARALRPMTPSLLSENLFVK
jgi:lipoyl(octanoyl) transferase